MGAKDWGTGNGCSYFHVIGCALQNVHFCSAQMRAKLNDDPETTAVILKIDLSAICCSCTKASVLLHLYSDC